MVTFDNYPKQQWQHLRTTNPVESLFSALRLRTRSKIQESDQSTDCHLEDAAGCGEEISWFEGSSIDEGCLSRSPVCRWSLC